MEAGDRSFQHIFEEPDHQDEELGCADCSER